MNEGTICLIDGCDLRASCKGMCHRHYFRNWAAGKYRRRRLPIMCDIRACLEPATRVGMCSAHYGWIRQAHMLNTNPEARRKRVANSVRYNKAHPENAARHVKRWHRITNWHKKMAFTCSSDAKRRGFPCDLDADYIKSLWEQQKGLCYWLGIPMVPSLDNKAPARPSLDKLDPPKGYTRGNVVLTTMFANMGRNSCSAEAFREFIANMRATIRNY